MADRRSELRWSRNTETRSFLEYEWFRGWCVRLVVVRCVMQARRGVLNNNNTCFACETLNRLTCHTGAAAGTITFGFGVRSAPPAEQRRHWNQFKDYRFGNAYLSDVSSAQRPDVHSRVCLCVFFLCLSKSWARYTHAYYIGLRTSCDRLSSNVILRNIRLHVHTYRPKPVTFAIKHRD